MHAPRWIKAIIGVAVIVVAIVVFCLVHVVSSSPVTAQDPAPTEARLTFYDESELGHWVKSPKCPAGTSAVDINAGGLDNDRSTVIVDPHFNSHGVGEYPVIKSTNSSSIIAVIPMRYIPQDISGVEGDYWGFWRYEAPDLTSRLLIHDHVNSGEMLRVCIR